MAAKKNKNKKATPSESRRAPPRMVLRRNLAPAAPLRAPMAVSVPTTSTKPATPGGALSSQLSSIRARVGGMGESHVVSGLGAGALGNALGLLVVGQGWLGPKTYAAIVMGTGAAATTAGYKWESDHLMAAGAGLAVAGTFSLANAYALQGLEAGEKLVAEKQAKQQLARRNGPVRLVVVHEDED